MQQQLSSQMAELSILYGFDAWTMELNTVDITDPKGRKIEVVLGNYKKPKPAQLALQSKIYLSRISPRSECVLDIKIEEIEINVPKTTNFSIPSDITIDCEYEICIRSCSTLIVPAICHAQSKEQLEKERKKLIQDIEKTKKYLESTTKPNKQHSKISKP